MKLLIIESPSKQKTIQKYLGSEWKICASFGHIRYLEHNLDFLKNDFEVKYDFLKEKQKAISQIKQLAKESDDIYLGADKDNEGEQIAYSVSLLLKLNPKTAKRVVYTEITESAIKYAINNPTIIDINKVDTQKARAVLDLMIGFTLSPILWNHIAPSLSAGRCLTPSLRIVVEREEQIKNFKPSSGWQLSTDWKTKDGFTFNAKLEDELDDNESAINYLENIHQITSGTIVSKEVKEFYENPPEAFTSSTLQQQSSAILKINPKQTMRVAQTLYEKGLITYLRTDVSTMSETAKELAKNTVKELYGEQYINTLEKQETKKKQTKKDDNDGPKVQAAHECIRPTDFSLTKLPDDEEWMGQERKVYQLIWKRAVQSVMSHAKGLVCTIKTQIEDDEDFLWKSQWRHTTFEGWKILGKVAQIDDTDSTDETDSDDTHNKKETEWQSVQKLKQGDNLQWLNMKAEPTVTKAPPRFTEAMLVRELEKYGIGRPSTYVSLLTKIQEKKYVEIKDIPPKEVQVTEYTLKPNQWPPTEISLKKKLGAEKSKLVPTDLGRSVLQFLLKHFNDLFEYSFTAQMEKRLDRVAEGKENWKQSLRDMWASYKDRYEALMNTATIGAGVGTGAGAGTEENQRVREFKSESGKGGLTEGCPRLKAILTKKGPLLLRESESRVKEETEFYGWPSGVSFQDLTEKQALEFIAQQKEKKLGQTLGEWNEHPILKKSGKFGEYIQCGEISIPFQSETETLDQIKKRFSEKQEKQEKGPLKKFKEYEVRQGQYGPFIMKTSLKTPKFVSVPKDVNIETLTEKDVEGLYKVGLESKKNYKSNKSSETHNTSETNTLAELKPLKPSKK